MLTVTEEETETDAPIKKMMMPIMGMMPPTTVVIRGIIMDAASKPKTKREKIIPITARAFPPFSLDCLIPLTERIRPMIAERIKDTGGTMPARGPATVDKTVVKIVERIGPPNSATSIPAKAVKLNPFFSSEAKI